jgi:hypothetical protein
LCGEKVREELLPNVVPDVLSGIEFRAVRGEMLEANIVWNEQVFTGMRRSTIPYQKNQLIWRSIGEFFQKEIHRLPGHRGSNKKITTPVGRTDGPISIGITANQLA